MEVKIVIADVATDATPFGLTEVIAATVKDALPPSLNPVIVADESVGPTNKVVLLNISVTE